MLALGAFMVPAGRIGDIFGRRRALLMVMGFRAVLGLGAALIFPVSVSVLTNAFPPKRASHAIGMAYGIAGLGNPAGPLIGSLLTETVGWRAIFWLNVPFVVMSLVLGAVSIDESSDSTVPRRIDMGVCRPSRSESAYSHWRSTVARLGDGSRHGRSRCSSCPS
jgi:MFS family permease